ncbi:PDR/VanB family oxidoreductase [Alcaligenes parafaecalis]|uniref:PDR/VanB family oxidoreductase n=1 Tax=Alcaligenes parafaecalis TaxID=171260 RepID=A0ABT3VSZ0_9BURK|nr:PDR/VanB family oxidoreductase [Alcaligenes parafaecalis]MCX5465340.1 PDR/VanB family oxidoreductase [Alcaligenes parafaecalis]
MSTPTLTARVYAMRYEADGIVSVEFRPATEQLVFPPFEPGSHIDLYLPNGLVRNYSLCNSHTDEQRYVVAVLHDRNSRGGSCYVHEQLRVGATIEISAPRNHFALIEQAPKSVLLAGGIGITPLWCMLQKLAAQGQVTELFYCARNRREAAFVSEIQDLCESRDIPCHFHFDQEQGSAPQLQTLLAGRGPDAHYYCCGPAPMLAAFEAACHALGYENVHIERFAAVPVSQDVVDDAFELRLAKSDKTIHVPAGKSILDALLDAGISIEHSCKDGVCGSCETRILEGEADHRDGVLSEKERAAGRSLMVCVSRCKRGPLVLDI